MTKISKIVAAASALGMLGIAALPVAGYAVDNITTTVAVTIGAECLIGAGSDNESGEDLSLNLSVGTPSGEDAAGASIDVVCNSAWTLTEAAADTTLKLETTPGNYTGTSGFNTWTTGTTPTDFTDNTWSMKYSGASGATVPAGMQAYHAVSTTPTTIASGNATAKSSITQTFGAKTNGSVAGGTYGTVMTYTLSGS